MTSLDAYDGHELCDLLAVFGDYVFIFFDRENTLPEVPDKDPQVLWDRWKRNVIDRQVKTAHGAERYIRSGRAAVFMSLIQSAKLNGHNPYAYLKDVFARLPSQPANRIEELLPHRWQPLATGA